MDACFQNTTFIVCTLYVCFGLCCRRHGRVVTGRHISLLRGNRAVAKDLTRFGDDTTP